MMERLCPYCEMKMEGEFCQLCRREITDKPAYDNKIKDTSSVLYSLLLYNLEKKQIQKFDITETDIFIGRQQASHRSFLDIATPLEEHYMENSTEKDWQEKIKILKGISNKHGQICKHGNKFYYKHLSTKSHSFLLIPDKSSEYYKQISCRKEEAVVLKNENIIMLGDGIFLEFCNSLC